MNTNVHILDPCSSSEWLQFICSHPHASVFHHPSWLHLLKSAYGFRMFAVCVKRGNGIVAGIPFAEVRSVLTATRWVSLPFSDYCQPLLPEGDAEASAALLGFLNEKREEGLNRIEIRWPFPSQSRCTSEYVHHRLPLQADPEAVFASFRKSTVQRHIRQSHRSGLEIRRCASEEEFMQYYPLQVITRKRLGVPAQPRSFFRHLWSHVLEPGHGYALLAHHDGRAVAGAVFLEFRHTTYYKYGASDYAFRSLNANHALMWEAIRQACSKGHAVFYFGRSDKVDQGLRQYKNGWGTTEQELAYTVLAQKPPRSGTSRLHELASIVIRHSPRFVCTISGELLYKHFA